MILVMAVSLVACNGDPHTTHHRGDDVYTEVFEDWYQAIAPTMKQEAKTDTYTFQLVIKTSPDTIYSFSVFPSELDYKDVEVIAIDGSTIFKKSEGYVHYTQPDEGLGARDWKIKFDVFFTRNVNADVRGSNKVPMYICNAVGIDENGNEITDEQLGYQASLLNGWLVAEFSNYLDEYVADRTSRIESTHTIYRQNAHRRPTNFTLSVMDISDVSDKTKKISSLPALDSRIVGVVFECDPDYI